MPPVLIGDSDRLRQVLINLSSNALKFTREGEVRIEARQIGSDGKHSLIRVEVHDTGIGIAPDQMSRIFEPFTQVDDSSSRKVGGVGLGLAISKELVSLMGGKLGGESKPGEGSTFWIEIPFEIAIQSLRIEVPATAVQQRFDGRVVLLVEDNAVNRLVARKLLDRTGCRTVVAEDGEQCLLRLNEEHFDLILMDVQMPGMSGLEATREIRRLESALRNIPIVALTASSMPGDREQCIAAGMNDYLSKPIAAADLHLALSRWLGSSTGKQGENS